MIKCPLCSIDIIINLLDTHLFLIHDIKKTKELKKIVYNCRSHNNLP
jgi:hypothetical protein